MDEVTRFAAMLAEDYGWGDCVLAALSRAPGADSQTFRVERGGEAVAELHAYRTSWIDWIGARQVWPERVAVCAGLLAGLAERDYPAPRVIATSEGELVALREGWAVLLTSYVGGERHDYSASELLALGEAVGRLNALPLATGVDSWWSLGEVVLKLAERLAAVVASWREWYAECLRELAVWPGRIGLPVTWCDHASGGALGAALVAGVSVGAWDWGMARVMATPRGVAEPNTATGASYARAYRAYRELYPALRGYFRGTREG